MRTVLCAYCARENPKKIQSCKKIQKNFQKSCKNSKSSFWRPNPTQPREDGAVEETDGREYFAFCVWIRFRVVNGGLNDGTMDGTMDGMME